MPRPLLCVLLGLTKHWAAATAVKTAFIDSDTGRPFLDAYFPERLRASFLEQFPKHPLRREIIATTTVNYAINNAGVTFLWRMMQTTSKDIGAVLHAYLDADRESGAPARRDAIAAAGMKPEEEFAALLADRRRAGAGDARHPERKAGRPEERAQRHAGAGPLRAGSAASEGGFENDEMAGPCRQRSLLPVSSPGLRAA